MVADHGGLTHRIGGFGGMSDGLLCGFLVEARALLVWSMECEIVAWLLVMSGS